MLFSLNLEKRLEPSKTISYLVPVASFVLALLFGGVVLVLAGVALAILLVVAEMSNAVSIKQWIYEPYILNGVPRPVKFTVVVRFNLQNR